MINKIY